MSDNEEPEYYNLSQAEISKDKVANYLLNLMHPEGGSKAKFFWARGFNTRDWEVLADALKAQGIRNPVAARIPTDYGIKIIIRCNVETPDGLNPCIVTVWMHAEGENPHLVTAIPYRRSDIAPPS